MVREAAAASKLHPLRTWLYGDGVTGRRRWTEACEEAREPGAEGEHPAAHHHHGKHDHDPNETSMIDVRPAPAPTVGIALDPMQRVLQVAVGAEHGVMLTDSGIAFTWGDNRYGQLGRRSQSKQENGMPYPVEAILNEEVRQVAAGLHHCLALVARGEVYAWGRNKDGQCGTGTDKDITEPKKVVQDESRGSDKVKYLGGSPATRIIAIGAGGKSSIAAGIDSSVWQWGEINDKTKDLYKGDSKQSDASEGVAGGAAGKSGSAANAPNAEKKKPCLVMHKGLFKETKTRGKIKDLAPQQSVSAIGCNVYPATTTVEREGEKDKVAVEKDKVAEANINDQVQAIVQLQNVVAKERQDLADSESKATQGDAAGAKDGGEASSAGEIQRLSETIAALEIEYKDVNEKLRVLNHHIRSVLQQQELIRKQKQGVEQQRAILNNKQDDAALKMFESPDKKKRKAVEDELADIRRLVDANSATLASLDAETKDIENERSRLNNDRSDKEKRKVEVEKKLKLVRQLHGLVSEATSEYNKDVKFLKDQKDEIATHFARHPALGSGHKPDEKAVIEGMSRAEEDGNFLDDIESKVETLRRHSGEIDSAREARAGEICDLLMDLINLQRAKSRLREHALQVADEDLSHFLEKPGKLRGFEKAAKPR